ncbi:MAG: hypothetical protein PQJ58_18220, partial [Spirochaetales bacterium]|nr:hypothetical protein [Spirochaetales bacterium]
MKRFVGSFLLMILGAAAVFAAGTQEAAASSASTAGSGMKATAIGIGYNSTNYKLGYDSLYESSYDGIEERIKFPAFTFNVTGFSSGKQEKFVGGFLYDIDLMLLSSPTYTEETDGIQTDEEDLSLEGYNTGFGMHMILGPGFNLVLADSISLQLGAGVHFNLATMGSSDYLNDSLFGVGLGVGNITRLNWQFSDNMGLMLGLDMAWDFLSFVSGYDIDALESGNGSAFSISPLILISFGNLSGSSVQSGSVARSRSGGSSSGSISSGLGGISGGSSGSSS